MIAYIIFEKQEEDGRPPWSAAAAHEFIKQRQADPDGGVGKLIGLYEKSTLGYDAVVAKLDCATADRGPRDTAFRIVPISKSGSYLVEEDPALDDFLVLYSDDEPSDLPNSAPVLSRP
jgi:hypothetical protein